MRTRFGFTLALVLVAGFPAFAQPPNEGHPGERQHEQGQRGPQAHGPNTPRANQGHVPVPPPQHESHAKPEPEHRPNGKINGSQHLTNDHWHGHVRIDRDHHRFWFPGGFYFEVAAWDGRSAPIGAGTAAMTSSSTKIPITRDGICCTTSISDIMSTSCISEFSVFATAPSRGILLVSKPRRKAR